MRKSKDNRAVCLLRMLCIVMLVALSGCAASNAVLNRAEDQRQTQIWVPQVQQVTRADGVWQISGQAWLVPPYSRAAADDWTLCISGSLSVDPETMATMSCSLVETATLPRVVAEPVSVDTVGAVTLPEPNSGSQAITEHYLVITYVAPALAGVPRHQVFRAARSGADGEVVSLHFSEHRRTQVTREGNALWYGLMPLALVADIVIAPVQLIAYIRHVRRENNKLAPQ